ncbi:MAG: hypothetical protein WCL18_02885 [bacterium]
MLVPLTISQTIKWLDSRDYGLRGAKMIILMRDDSPALYSGVLLNLQTNGEVTFLSDAGDPNPKNFNVKKQGVLIIYRGDTAKYAVKSSSPNPESLTIKVLTSLLRLTILQAEKWLDNYDYRLRGSQALLFLDNDPIPWSGELTDANANGEIALLSDKGEQKTFYLKEHGVLIVFQGDKPRYAVCNR